MQTASNAAATGPAAFGAAIQGQRSEQQDSFRSIWLAAEQAWLLIVADGMGGHSAGGTASRIAADSFLDSFTASQSKGVDLQSALSAALEDANAQIAKAQAVSPELSGMGTTLVAVYLSPRNFGWISVGDSPFWHYRDGKMQRLNEDHSLRGMLKDGTKVSGSILRSVLNGEPIALIDCQVPEQQPAARNILVLASDGLLTLQEQEIATEIARNSRGGAESIARALLKAVENRAKSRQDNCTVIVAETPAPASGKAMTERAAPAPASAPKKKSSTPTLALAAFIILAIAVSIWAWPF